MGQELKRIYGRRAQDEWHVQLLAFERRLKDLQCNSAEESRDFIVKLNTIWGECEALGDTKAYETKRAAFLLGDQGGATSSVYSAYNPARYVVMSSTCLTSDFERCDESVAFQSRTDGTKAGMRLDDNQCAYCLKRNHRWRDCRLYLSGKRLAKRPPGMNPARTFPPPPRNDSRKEKRIKLEHLR